MCQTASHEGNSGSRGCRRVAGGRFTRDGAAVAVSEIVLIERVGDTVRLRPPADERDRRAVTVNYDVRVPANTKILTVSDSGETTIAGLTGVVDVRTQSGAIALQRIGGATTISTGSGAVVVEETKGPLTVTTSSSAFTARALGGNLRVRTMSGAINAGFEGGGDVDIETGSSGIQLRGVRGAVSAATRSGRAAPSASTSDANLSAARRINDAS